MSEDQLKPVLDAMARMQSGWSESTDLATMRSDLEDLYLSFDGLEGSSVVSENLGGVPVDRVAAPGVSDEKIIVLFHGGGFSMGSARSHRHMAQWISSISGCQVLLPDYRLVPEHVFPAQLDDAFEVYQALLTAGAEPAAIALMGDSAGGGLVLSLLSRIRAAGLAMPSCACLMSPWIDLQCSGDSYHSLAEVDPVATHDMALAMGLGYVGQDGDISDPLANPAMLDFDGFPPLLVQAGDREIFLDDARTAYSLARESGVNAEFSVWSGMIHQWHLYAGVLNEAREAIDEQAQFLASHMSG